MLLSRRSLMGGAVAIAASAARPGFTAEPGVPRADRELRVPVEGGSLYVRVNGNLAGTRAPLILVHGGPLGALWQFFPALPLAIDRAVILYDQLDSGRSDAPGDPANWTVDRFANEIEAVRLSLGIERFHLLGHSWGGIVANRYAARRPPALRSLVLQGAPLSAGRGEASIRALAAQLPEADAAAIAAYHRDGRGGIEDAAYRKASSSFMRRHIFRTSVRDIAMPYMAPTPEDRGNAVASALVGDDLLAGFRGIMAGFDDESLLSQIAVPTLLLRGEFDIMNEEATRAMLPRLRNGRYVEIPGAGHMAQFDQPQAWRETISEFLARSRQ